MQVETTVVLEDEVPYAEVDVQVTLRLHYDTRELDIYTIEVADIITGKYVKLNNEYGPVSVAVWRWFNKKYDDLLDEFLERHEYKGDNRD